MSLGHSFTAGQIMYRTFVSSLTNERSKAGILAKTPEEKILKIIYKVKRIDRT